MSGHPFLLFLALYFACGFGTFTLLVFWARFRRAAAFDAVDALVVVLLWWAIWAFALFEFFEDALMGGMDEEE